MSFKLDDLKQEENFKILVIGESGAGKTVFASSFVGPIFYHDFDGKVISAANYLRANNPEKLKEIEFENYVNPRSANTEDDTKLKYATFNSWLIKMKQLASKGEALPFKTVVLDSITTWSELLMAEVLRQSKGKIKPSIPGIDNMPSMQHYGLNSVYFKEQLNLLLSLPCNVVVLGHVETEKDELTGALERKAKVSGKLATWLPIVFGEVYRAYVEEKNGKKVYMLQTQTDSKFNCRTQISGLPANIEAKYENLIRR